MIWALLIGYFLYGGIGAASGGALTSADAEFLSDQVEVIIVDEQRADAATDVLKELRKDTRAFEKSFISAGRQLDKAYRDYAADRTQVDAVLNDLNSQWSETQQRMLDLRFELRETMTEEEWSAMFAGD